MKTKLILAATLLSAFSFHHPAFAQGSLTPPGAPGPTMKTLDQVRPGIPLPATAGYFNITNPGCYYLITNLTISGGITISTNGVDLDLNGFTLSGTVDNIAVQTPFSGGPYTNIVIHNGTIADSGYGAVLAQNSEGLVCENLLITDCTVGNLALLGGPHSVIRHCALHNVKNGISVGVESVVEDCIVANSAQSGINVDTNSVVRRCLVTHCNYSGIQTTSGGLIADNVISECGFGNAAGAIFLFASGTRMEDNQISSSYSWLTAFSGTNFIFRNTSIGSGAAALSGTQVIGPIISTTGTITTNNPWANFVY